jgi:hypothetical protein
MAKSHDLVHDIEDDLVLHQAVIVDLCQILDLRDAALIVLEVMLLQTNAHRLDDVVDDPHDKLRAIPVKVCQQGGKKVDGAIFDFPRLGKNLLKRFPDLDE